MMISAESLAVPDDGPEPDAVDQLRPVIGGVDDAGLDPTYVTKTRDWDVNQADLIDQAIAITLPDDDYENEAELDR